MHGLNIVNALLLCNYLQARAITSNTPSPRDLRANRRCDKQVVDEWKLLQAAVQSRLPKILVAFLVASIIPLVLCSDGSIIQGSMLLTRVSLRLDVDMCDEQ